MSEATAAGEISEAAHFERLRAAARRVLQGRPSGHAAACAALALEVCAERDELQARLDAAERAHEDALQLAYRRGYADGVWAYSNGVDSAEMRQRLGSAAGRTYDAATWASDRPWFTWPDYAPFPPHARESLGLPTTPTTAEGTAHDE